MLLKTSLVSWASRAICTSYGVRPKSPRRVSFKEFCKAQTLWKVSFKEAWNAKALGGCRLKAANYWFWHFGPKAAQMLRMVSFDIALDHYGPKAVQMLPIASLRIILDCFGPRAAQMLEVISSGAILDHFGCPKKSTYFKWSALVSFWFGFNIVDQIHPNPFESIEIQPDPPRFGSAFSRPCEHMAQLSVRKSHPFGKAFPFERLFPGMGSGPGFSLCWRPLASGPRRCLVGSADLFLDNYSVFDSGCGWRSGKINI